MNRYTVTWLESARDQLAEIWLAASDRKAITTATHEIEQQLSRDASTRGNEVSEGLRSLEVHPLRVLFSVNEADRTVEVSSVRVIVNP